MENEYEARRRDADLQRAAAAANALNRFDAVLAEFQQRMSQRGRAMGEEPIVADDGRPVDSLATSDSSSERLLALNQVSAMMERSPNIAIGALARLAVDNELAIRKPAYELFRLLFLENVSRNSYDPL